MGVDAPTRDEILEAIRDVATRLRHPPSRAEFIRESGISEYKVLRHFDRWNDAVKHAGLAPDTSNLKIEDEDLLMDWGTFVRTDRQIPARSRYERHGKYSAGTLERRFGTWSSIPDKFREYAKAKQEWADVLVLLPATTGLKQQGTSRALPVSPNVNSRGSNRSRVPTYKSLDGRPTYGSPMDFRGMRHKPVNEAGVVFLFGMVAKELGFLVEAVQTGYPDCEAKRQVGPEKWQRVRIEFEFESRNFRDHGHTVDGCDIIVCWRHNWNECPESLEILELAVEIQTLAKSDD